jgi:hypothetical protein
MKKQTPVTGESSLRARAEEALRTPVHAFSQEQVQALNVVVY